MDRSLVSSDYKPGLEEARAIFDEEDHSCSWPEWVWKFRLSGVYVNDRGVCLFAEKHLPHVWKIWYASGPLLGIASAFPHRLDYIAWMRRKTKRLHFARWDRIHALATIHGRKFQHQTFS